MYALYDSVLDKVLFESEDIGEVCEAREGYMEDGYEGGLSIIPVT